VIVYVCVGLDVFEIGDEVVFDFMMFLFDGWECCLVC